MTRYIITDDNVWAEGFEQVVSDAWQEAVPATLKRFVESQSFASQLPQILRGLSDCSKATEEQRQFIDSVGVAILDRREKFKGTATSPRDILEKAFSVAAEQMGFGPEAPTQLVDIADKEYLSAYVNKAKDGVVVSEQGTKIFAAMGEGDTVIRAPHKRNNFIDNAGHLIDVMAPESEKIRKSPRVSGIEDAGMNRQGDDYAQYLPIGSDQRNVVIASHDKVAKLSDESTKITEPLAAQAANGNLLIFSINEKQQNPELTTTEINGVATPMLQMSADQSQQYIQNPGKVWQDFAASLPEKYQANDKDKLTTTAMPRSLGQGVQLAFGKLEEGKEQPLTEVDKQNLADGRRWLDKNVPHLINGKSALEPLFVEFSSKKAQQEALANYMIALNASISYTPDGEQQSKTIIPSQCQSYEKARDEITAGLSSLLATTQTQEERAELYKTAFQFDERAEEAFFKQYDTPYITPEVKEPATDLQKMAAQALGVARGKPLERWAKSRVEYTLNDKSGTMIANANGQIGDAAGVGGNSTLRIPNIGAEDSPARVGLMVGMIEEALVSGNFTSLVFPSSAAAILAGAPDRAGELQGNLEAANEAQKVLNGKGIDVNVETGARFYTPISRENTTYPVSRNDKAVIEETSPFSNLNVVGDANFWRNLANKGADTLQYDQNGKYQPNDPGQKFVQGEVAISGVKRNDRSAAVAAHRG